MKTNLSIRNRLILTSAFLSLIVAVALGLFVAYFLELAEKTLIRQTITREADMLASNHARFPNLENLRGNHYTIYVRGPGQHDPIPEAVLRRGGQSGEVILNDALYEMIYVKKGDFEYFYLSDFSEYEAFEARMYLLLIAGIAGAVLLGIWFGVYSSTKVLKPLSRLTDTMTKQSAADLTAMTPPAGYTDDEIGQLANKFFEYDAALKKIVVRLQTYTANVSHELRNPLFAISGATEILMLDTSQTDENRRTLGRIYQEAHVMGEKIELLLSIAQGSESVAVHEQLDVAAILKNQVNEHEPACLANEVNLSLCIEQEPVVFGTEHALTIILRNVLSNAIRYSGKGKIEVLLNERGIVVEDSGRGVPEEMRNLVFERFFRGPSAQGTEGIGIGLSLVSEVCKAYGWKISVDGARSGSGTRVTLELT